MHLSSSSPIHRCLAAAIAAFAAALALSACEPQRADKLVEDVSTEDDVRKLFGEPKTVTVAPDGTRTLEYPRQPEGWSNYVMVIGPNGKLSQLRQLLTPDNFAKVQPGMERAAVRQLLGPHATTQRFELKKDEEVVSWRFKDGNFAKLFSVTFGADGKVLSTATADDPRGTDGPSGK